MDFPWSKSPAIPTRFDTLSHKLQVFVSATSQDPRGYRTAAAGWLKAQGQETEALIAASLAECR